IAAAFRPALARVAGYRVIGRDLAAVSVPVLLTVATFGATWWYVVIYNAPEVTTAAVSPATKATAVTSVPVVSAPAAPTTAAAPAAEERPQELGSASDEAPQERGAEGGAERAAAPAEPEGAAGEAA